jgi:hypothetical protein
MANPQNPLDKYPIYTYHLALFMHHDQDALEQEMRSFDWENTPTTRKDYNPSVPSCLLNSVTDPFQSIQELKIEQIAPNVSSGYRASPWGQFSIRIVEPGNCMFLTKIKNLMGYYDVKAFASAVWGVKIKFVGRTETNDIETWDVDPMFGMLVDIRSNFTQMGSTYDLSFVMTDTMGVAQLPEHANSLQLGTMFEGVTLSGVTTISEAFNKLQERLQYNYDQEVQKRFPNADAKKVRYQIWVGDEEISDYPLDGSVTNKKRDAEKYFSWPKGTAIADALTEIVFRCPQLAAAIGDSKDVWKKPFNIGGKMYQILTKVIPASNEIVVAFYLTMYYGAPNEIKAGSPQTYKTTTHYLYEFDFYFAEKYNVDVINFDMSANVGLILYLTSTPRNTVANQLNLDGVAAGKNAVKEGNEAGIVVDENKKIEKHPDWPEDELNVDCGKRDMLVMANYPDYISQGRPGGETKGDKSRTQALESLAKYSSIDNISKNITIRGHYDILDISLRRGSTFGTTDGIWVKLNIWSYDEETGQRDKYFYDGVYQALGIQHSFMDGKFTQELTLMMMNFDAIQDLGVNF